MNKKILVVDDEEIMRNLLNDVLHFKGFEVLLSGEGKDALAQAKQHHPDLIILDINMPGISGCGVSTLLQQCPETKAIPILFLTGYLDKDEEDTIEGQLAGHYLLTKPFNNTELISLIERILANN